MRRLVEQVLALLRPGCRRWEERPDHESRSLLCRLAWHSWVVSTRLEFDRDDVDGGAARLVVVARERECRSCGRVEQEVRSP